LFEEKFREDRVSVVDIDVISIYIPPPLPVAPVFAEHVLNIDFVILKFLVSNTYPLIHPPLSLDSAQQLVTFTFSNVNDCVDVEFVECKTQPLFPPLCIPLIVQFVTEIDPDTDVVQINEPSFVFKFFSVQFVIVTFPVVPIDNGIYVPLKLITTVDPILVFVILNVPETTSINENPIGVPVGVNDDNVNVKLLVDDDIRGLTPLPSVVPNVIFINSNVNDPPFVIPPPLPPRLFPTVIIINDVELDFTLTFVRFTLIHNSPPLSTLISRPSVPFKCPVAFSIVLHL
jgi:hypothetical protein